MLFCLPRNRACWQVDQTVPPHTTITHTHFFSKQAARRPLQAFLSNLATPPPHTHTHTPPHTAQSEVKCLKTAEVLIQQKKRKTNRKRTGSQASNPLARVPTGMLFQHLLHTHPVRATSLLEQQ